MNEQTKPRRTLKQPRKAVLREQLALASKEIIALRAHIDRLQRPWWRRLLGRA